MKPTMPCLLVAAALFCCGCSTTSASDTKGRKVTIVKPTDRSLKRGETNRIAIVVLRENLASPLEVSFSNLPPGTKVVEQERTISAEQIVVNFTLYADNDAVLVANRVAKVTVTAPDGLAATAEFLVSVVE